MGQKITLGGDRLGSGKKMQTELYNYGMSTHDLSTIFRTTAAAGILYPSLVLVGERDDHFKIKLEQDVRTQPTVAPLFGSFKLQTDVFMCPIRLYQGLLHNNPTELGRQMTQVKLPKVQILSNTSNTIAGNLQGKFSDNCLMKYLGVSGIGRAVGMGTQTLQRKFNSVPMLAYYDIFKNYYSNKQEEEAYVISSITKQINTTINKAEYRPTTGGVMLNGWIENNIANYPIDWANVNAQDQRIALKIEINVNQNKSDELTTKLNDHLYLTIYRNGTYQRKTISQWNRAAQEELFQITNGYDGNKYKYIYITMLITLADTSMGDDAWGTSDTITKLEIEDFTEEGTDYLNLTPFKLANIDQMRYDVLTHCKLGESFVISESEHNYLPYSTIVERNSNGETLNKLPLNGLCVKTYQSDLFNNWLNAEWIDGENGVAEISKIVTDEDGAFTIDQLQFAKKIYNLYNRIAISGATYYEWQNVVWSESKQTHVENPVYVGGYAAEICFEEVVQTTSVSGEKPLGQLGGKGRKIGDKGGYIEVDCDEACFILAITSITPHISYTQGNEWYMTELDSIDDLHKPEFDNIGFQDLIGERLAFWDTQILPTGTIVHRSKIGKVPAWIDYQTNYDRTFGEFCDIEKAGYMVLTRHYDYDEDTKGIKDVTTYIDPKKYNYAFALTDIDAQNFWLQTNFDIKARRRMSAHLIPQA